MDAAMMIFVFALCVLAGAVVFAYAACVVGGALDAPRWLTARDASAEADRRSRVVVALASLVGVAFFVALPASVGQLHGQRAEEARQAARQQRYDACLERTTPAACEIHWAPGGGGGDVTIRIVRPSG